MYKAASLPIGLSNAEVTFPLAYACILNKGRQVSGAVPEEANPIFPFVESRTTCYDCVMEEDRVSIENCFVDLSQVETA